MMTMIRRQLLETSDTAEEKIKYFKSTIQKNVVIGLIVGSVVIFLLLIFCYIRYRNGRSVTVMSRQELKKRKVGFKRVLEPEEKKRKIAALARRRERSNGRSRGYENPDGDRSMETNVTAISSDIETGEVYTSESKETGSGDGIEVSPLHKKSGVKIESSRGHKTRADVGHECIELHAYPVK